LSSEKKGRLSFSDGTPIIQISKLPQTDKETKKQSIFCGLTAAGSIKIFALEVAFPNLQEGQSPSQAAYTLELVVLCDFRGPLQPPTGKNLKPIKTVSNDLLFQQARRVGNQGVCSLPNGALVCA